jgi:hypothetical protein
MSDPSATMLNVRPSLETLTHLSARPDATSQVEFLDHLNTYAVQLCQRPGDWQRVARNLQELVQEVNRCRRT